MLKVIKSGFYTTVQDTGRYGHRASGVPVSGVMDSYSGQFANALIGNASDDAVLEMTMTGPTLQFLQPTVIALSGADMSPMLNNKAVKMNTALVILEKDILSFGKLTSGFRTYLAIKGGVLSDLVLGSRSMYKGLTSETSIKINEIFAYKSHNNHHKSQHANVKYNRSVIEEKLLDVYKGPEYDTLPPKIQKQLFDTDFTVSRLNNRMAYQLEPLFSNGLDQLLTSPVLPGTIQLTPSGQLIVLMRDCQTTGGYPRILQLTEKAINCLSQKIAGSTFQIRLKDF